MSSLITALNAETVTTENGAKAYASTLNSNLDLFYACGASRGKDINHLFAKAYVEDSDLAIRIALYCRDIRQGQGERQQFKNFLNYLIEEADRNIIIGIIYKIPEVGRFDDLMVFFGTKYERDAIIKWCFELGSKNGLAFKWAPRQDRDGAKPLRKALNMSPKQWRKLVVGGSDTVEQKMCAKIWDAINFEHVPSVAAGRYQKAFTRNCGERYGQYLESLKKGEAKVNAGAVYPYDVIQSLRAGSSSFADAQWKALPDFMKGNDENILPIIDCSGSMYERVAGNISALDIAISLGIYTSERNSGKFKDTFMTFSDIPELCTLKGSLSNKLTQILASNWGYSTNLEAVFTTLLNAAVQHNVPEEDMPTKLLVVSDMQFNCMNGNQHVFDMAKSKYEVAGYKLPQIVFWQVNLRAGGIPVAAGTGGTALVSGFSPSIMKSLLKGDLEPVKVMLDTVMVDRYKIADL